MSVHFFENQVPIRNMSTEDRVLSVVGGSLLAIAGVKRKSGIFSTLAGLELVRRGLSGHCYAYQLLGIRTKPSEPWRSVSIPYELGVAATSSITVNLPRERVFEFWRDLSNLPKVMHHLVSVTQDGEKFSHWVAEGPGGRQMEWDAEIINEIPDELLAWRSLPGSQVDSAGSVRFKDAPGGRGTELRVELQYNPPGGIVGATMAKLFGRDPQTEIEEDLYRLKQFLETGELATTWGQPRGGTGTNFANGRLRKSPAEGIGK